MNTIDLVLSRTIRELKKHPVCIATMNAHYAYKYYLGEPQDINGYMFIYPTQRYFENRKLSLVAKSRSLDEMSTEELLSELHNPYTKLRAVVYNFGFECKLFITKRKFSIFM